MGGSAFHHLKTPRMPPAIYTLVKNTTNSSLLQHFKYVATPLEAPGKEDYGDIDIVASELLKQPRAAVAGIEDEGKMSSWLQEILNATDVIHDRGSSIWNLAIPWPSDESPLFSSSSTNESPEIETQTNQENTSSLSETLKEDAEDDEEQKHIQIDIHICPNPSSFHWTTFHSAHGDLWNILRSIISKQSLKATDEGFFLVDTQIEPFNRGRSRTKLTTFPSAVLQFLGLDESRYWSPFETERELFEYIASCRFFSLLEPPPEEVEETGKDGEGEIQKKKPKRLNPYKRKLFTLWLEEFLPSIQQTPELTSEYQRTLPTHSDLLKQVFAFFPGSELPHKTTHKEFFLERHLDSIFRSTMKGSIPVDDVEPQFRAAAVKMLKRVIVDVDGELEEESLVDGDDMAVPRRDEEGYFNELEVKEFVLAKWEVAGKVGMQRQMEKGRAAQKRKEEERRLKAAILAEE